MTDEQTTAWSCDARKQGTAGGNDPAECDWPTCGCDPYANKVMQAIEDRPMSNWEEESDRRDRRQDRREALRLACETTPKLPNGTPAETILARARVFALYLTTDAQGSEQAAEAADTSG